LQQKEPDCRAANAIKTRRRFADGKKKDSRKRSARSVASDAAAGSHQSSRPRRTQCASGKGAGLRWRPLPQAEAPTEPAGEKAVRQSALTEGVDRPGAEGESVLCSERLRGNGAFHLIRRRVAAWFFCRCLCGATAPSPPAGKARVLSFFVDSI